MPGPTTYFTPQPPPRPAVFKLVNMTPEQSRRQDQQVEWLRLALDAQSVPSSLGVGSHTLDPASLNVPRPA